MRRVCKFIVQRSTPRRQFTTNRKFKVMADQPTDINAVFDQYKSQIDKAISDLLPRKFDNEGISHLCGPARYAYDLDTATNALLTPMWDLLDRGSSAYFLFFPAELILTFLLVVNHGYM
jgi:hypothetical protein